MDLWLKSRFSSISVKTSKTWMDQILVYSNIDVFERVNFKKYHTLKSLSIVIKLILSCRKSQPTWIPNKPIHLLPSAPTKLWKRKSTLYWSLLYFALLTNQPSNPQTKKYTIMTRTKANLLLSTSTLSSNWWKYNSKQSTWGEIVFFAWMGGTTVITARKGMKEEGRARHKNVLSC